MDNVCLEKTVMKMCPKTECLLSFFPFSKMTIYMYKTLTSVPSSKCDDGRGAEDQKRKMGGLG